MYNCIYLYLSNACIFVILLNFQFKTCNNWSYVGLLIHVFYVDISCLVCCPFFNLFVQCCSTIVSEIVVINIQHGIIIKKKGLQRQNLKHWTFRCIGFILYSWSINVDLAVVSILRDILHLLRESQFFINNMGIKITLGKKRRKTIFETILNFSSVL